MHKSFTIKNFRGFENLHLEPLGHINLIAGKNSVGKTALLEALWLHHGYYNPELVIRVDAFRGLKQVRSDEFGISIFREFDPDSRIELASCDTEGQSQSLQITIQDQPVSRLPLRNGEQDTGSASQETTESFGKKIVLSFTDASGNTLNSNISVLGDTFNVEGKLVKGPSGLFLTTRDIDDYKSLAERFSNLAIVKEQHKIVDILKIIAPSIKDLQIIYDGHTPVFYADIGTQRLMPLPLMGNGIRHLLIIAVAIPEAKDGILLIDEIENGLHYTVMSGIWKAIATFAKEFNVQIFATTHSKECIDAFQEGLSALAEDDISGTLIRLDQKADGLIQPVFYSLGDLAITAEQDIEVR